MNVLYYRDVDNTHISLPSRMWPKRSAATTRAFCRAIPRKALAFEAAAEKEKAAAPSEVSTRLTAIEKLLENQNARFTRSIELLTSRVERIIDPEGSPAAFRWQSVARTEARYGVSWDGRDQAKGGDSRGGLPPLYSGACA